MAVGSVPILPHGVGPHWMVRAAVALNDGAVSRLLKDDQLAGAYLNADYPFAFAWLRRKVG